jgi:hypothetical protein
LSRNPGEIDRQLGAPREVFEVGLSASSEQDTDLEAAKKKHDAQVNDTLVLVWITWHNRIRGKGLS